MNLGEGSKPYKITFEERPDYLYVKIEGEEDSFEISRQFWLEVAEKCAKLKPKRLFIEEDLKEKIDSAADTYRGAAERAQMGFEGVKIAFFDTQAEHHEANKFGELVARNRGINVKVFLDRE